VSEGYQPDMNHEKTCCHISAHHKEFEKMDNKDPISYDWCFLLKTNFSIGLALVQHWFSIIKTHAINVGGNLRINDSIRRKRNP